MIKDKVVVITGASSGFGKNTALLLAEKGAKVVLGARRESRLQKVASEINANGGDSTYLVTDVKDHKQVTALADKAIATYGRIDVWINNAGVMPQGLFIENQLEDWENAIDINIKGVLNGISASLPYMQKQKCGQIINISSVAGVMAHAGTGVYSATKWAVRAISESLREEMADMDGNLRVTIISPGSFKTELMNSMNNDNFKSGVEDFYNKFAITPERVAQTIAESIDLPDDTSWNEVIIRPTKQVV